MSSARPNPTRPAQLLRQQSSGLAAATEVSVSDDGFDVREALYTMLDSDRCEELARPYKVATSQCRTVWWIFISLVLGLYFVGAPNYAWNLRNGPFMIGPDDVEEFLSSSNPARPSAGW